MSIRPVASQEATPPTARASRAGVIWGFCAVAAFLIGSLSASHAAEDAQAVLKKMLNTYATAKTYQGHITIRRAGKGRDGKAISQTITQQIRYKSPNMFYVQTTINLVGGPAGAGRSEGNTVAADGHSVIIYSPARKQYIKQNTAPAVPLVRLLQSVIPTDTTHISLLPAKTVQGHSAYDVQVKPDPAKLPPNLSPAQKASIKPAQYLVAKQGYQLLRIIQSAGGTSAQVDLTGQVFNAAIPDSSFHFSPPAGAKQITPQPGGAPAPGGPPR